MKKLTISTCVSILALLLLFTNCRKQEKDIQVEPTTPTSVTDLSFFSKYVTQDPIVQKVITYVKKQNDAYNFAPEYSKVIGLPRWDKAIVINKNGSNSSTSRVTTGGNADTSMVYIPFAKDSQQVVNAALIVKIAADSISSRMLFKWQYSSFGYTETGGNTWNAKDVFNLFVELDNTVFGTTKFKVYDYNFLSEDIQTRVDKEAFARGDYAVTFTLNNQANNLASGRIVYLDICNSYEVCIEYEKKAFRGMETYSMINRPCAVWGTETRCTTYWFDIDDGGGGGGSSGGSGSGTGDNGGGGGGGSNPGDWPPPTNPEGCPPNGEMEPRPKVDKSEDPCGTGWIPKPQDPIDQHGFYASRKAELATLLENDPAALLPCDEIANMERYGSQWQNVASFQLPQAIKDRLAEISSVFDLAYGSTYQQTLDAASGTLVNCDYFPVKINSIPTGYTQESLLEYFRLNINSFITDLSKTKFEPFKFGCIPYENRPNCVDDTEKFNSPYQNSVGSLVHIDIMPNHGSVVLSSYFNRAPPIYTTTNSQFIFTTLHTPLDNSHPVAGNRAFGIFKNSTGQLTFYTTGVDRVWDDVDQLVNDMADNISFSKADELWLDVQKNFIKWINDQPGGQASSYTNNNKIVARPKWNDVKQFLKKEIDFNTLKARLGC